MSSERRVHRRSIVSPIMVVLGITEAARGTQRGTKEAPPQEKPGTEEGFSMGFSRDDIPGLAAAAPRTGRANRRRLLVLTSAGQPPASYRRPTRAGHCVTGVS